MWMHPRVATLFLAVASALGAETCGPGEPTKQRALLQQGARPARFEATKEANVSDITAVIVETRPQVVLPAVVNNLRYHLPGVAIQILYAASNELFVHNSPSLANLREEGILTLTRLPEPIFSNGLTRFPDTYSPMLWSRSFWEDIRPLRKKVLIFQTDTWVCAGAAARMEPLMRYDFIGSPFGEHAVACPGGVGNGGFSFRDREAMIKVIEESPAYDSKVNAPELEDERFCFFLQKGGTASIPDRAVAAKFSMAPVSLPINPANPEPLTPSVGIHKAALVEEWGHSLEELEGICPGVTLQLSVTDAEDDDSGTAAEEVMSQWSLLMSSLRG